MKSRVMVIAFLFLSFNVLADFHSNGTANITRKDAVRVGKVSELIETTMYNAAAKLVYDRMQVTEQKGKTYRDLGCIENQDHMGQAWYKEGTNMVCFRYAGCEKDLYFCKTLMNPFNGEMEEVRARTWE